MWHTDTFNIYQGDDRDQLIVTEKFIRVYIHENVCTYNNMEPFIHLYVYKNQIYVRSHIHTYLFLGHTTPYSSFDKLDKCVLVKYVRIYIQYTCMVGVLCAMLCGFLNLSAELRKFYWIYFHSKAPNIVSFWTLFLSCSLSYRAHYTQTCFFYYSHIFAYMRSSWNPNLISIYW